VATGRRLRVLAPAKINWTIEVLRIRPDGYHEIRSVLQTIDLVDRRGITAVHALTPGSLGVLAGLVARLLELPLSAEYGADLPLAVRHKAIELANALLQEGYEEGRAIRIAIRPG